MIQNALRGYREGQEIARMSVLALILVGVLEIGVGSLTNSLSVTADGIDSFSDAAISLIVWFGLRMSLKEPTAYFHYGYFKVESLVAFCTSIGMIGIATFILYRAYLSLVGIHRIIFPAYALIAVLIAGTISLYYALRTRKVARKYRLVSLQISAANSLKDASASFVVLGSVVLAAFGIIWMDPVGAILVSGYIYSVAYVAVRESSLALLDSFNSPEVVNKVRSIVESVVGVRRVKELKLRRSGPFLSGRVRIEVDQDLRVLEATKIANEVEATLSKEVGALKEFVVLFAPYDSRAMNNREEP